MNRIGRAAFNIYGTGMPYVKGFINKMASAGKKVKKSKRKAERYIRFMKLKQTIEFASNFVLLIAGVTAVAMMSFEFLRKYSAK